ncbi:MAG: hypothetical protein H8D45_20835 [Bacteroidetes bacterium]|nr:hypothetical protein [Bacteroidota bacterium]
MNSNYQKGYTPRTEIEFDLDNYYKYSYKNFIPEGYSKGYVHDIALAATILYAESLKQNIPYITEWEIDKVAKWVENINPRICYEVAKSCEEIARNGVSNLQFISRNAK